MTSIDDVIQPGQPIPDDVTEVKDGAKSPWRLTSKGHWHLRTAQITCLNDDCGGDGYALMRQVGQRLTVTAVREQPAESVSGLCEVGTDKVTCIVMDADHRRIYHGGRPVPPYASTEALLKVAEPQQPADAVPPEHFEEPVRIIEPLDINGLIRDSREIMALLGVTEAADVLPELTRRLAAPEPQQADASPVLDLVQQYGLQERQDGGSTRDPASPAAAALLARIAALVQREEADALQTITDRDLYHEWADKLATAIAERTGADIGEHSSANNPWRVAYKSLVVLVPQQPVQARDVHGALLWISETGTTVHRGLERPLGAWRPLFVGGDPAPERNARGLMVSRFPRVVGNDTVDLAEAMDAAPDGDRTPERCGAEACSQPAGHDGLHDSRRVSASLRDRHEPHVDGPREPSAQERADHDLMAVLGVEQLDDVMPAIKRLQALVDHLRNWRSEHDKRERERDEARAEVERLKRDYVTGKTWREQREAHLAEQRAAQPDPLVLSLPEVPEGTAAVVGTRWVGDEIRAVPHPSIRNIWVYEQDIDKAEAPCFSLPHFLADYGPLRVELAPPREPRTWSKLDPVPDDLRHVRGASGTVYDRSSGTSAFSGYRNGESVTRNLHILREEDGPLDEVLK